MTAALTLLLFIYFISKAETDLEYPVSSIPPELKQNANLVFRDHSLEFTVHNPKKAVKKERRVITILNAEGAHEADFYLGYDKFVKIRDFEGRILNEQGLEVKEIKNSEIKDYSDYDGFTLYSDNRLKYMNLKWSKYPYTIDVSYELDYNDLLFYPAWWPVGGFEEAVQHSEFRVITPEDLPLRYLPNLIGEPEILQSDGAIEYSWTLDNLRALPEESLAPPLAELVPWVRTAPTELKFGDFSGPMDSWEAIGKWQNHLNMDRNDLSVETVHKIRQMTQSAQSAEEKARIIYRYLQDNTRYVGIQLGIGGWQPFQASYVDEKGYGDCKALTFYAKSMLGAVGVESHYTLVYAGRNAPKLVPDFPSRQFNHVILCVPTDNDTIWLECTSQTNPFGFLGSSTEDRDVLLITNTGAQVVHTPSLGKLDNAIVRFAGINLDEEGNGAVEARTRYQGLKQEEQGLSSYIHEDEVTQRKWLYSKLDIPSYEIETFKFAPEKSKVPAISEELKIKVKNYASKSGKRMFLNPNMFNRWDQLPIDLEERKLDIVLDSEYLLYDSLHFTLPAGFYPEFTPENMLLESPFGRFEATYLFGETGLTYVRKLEVRKGRFPASSYEDLRDFMKKIVRADKNKVVLVDKT